jgi:hypothetical protein
MRLFMAVMSLVFFALSVRMGRWGGKFEERTREPNWAIRLYAFACGALLMFLVIRWPFDD